MKLWISTALMALTLMSANLSAETFYKWQDSEGVTHYGSLPPVGVDATPVDTVRGPKTPVAKPGPEPEVMETQQEFDQRLQKSEAEHQADLAKACQDAREGRVNMGSSHRIRLKQPDGSYKMLSEEEKQAEIAKLDKQIEEYCK